MINIGIIGCGRITDLHAPGYLRSERARIYAVCDARAEVAQKRLARWGAKRAYTDYRDLLADDAVDAVEIITPHHLHHEMCLAACAAGKHVSVQKPMALTIAECDAMIQAAKDAGVLLKVFENFVFYPPYVQAAALLRDGAVGQPLSLRMHLGGASRGGWHVPLSSWVWRLNSETCGGGPTIFDDGYHKFSVALELFGPVDRVHAWIDRSFAVIDAPAMISWTHKEGGKLGYLDAPFSPHLTVKSKYYAVDERVEVVGSEGVMTVTRCTGRLLEEPPLLLWRNGRTVAFDDLRADWLDSFIDSTEQFVDCILGEQGTPRLTGERGREVTRFALAALRSAERGREVAVAEVV